MRSFLYTLARLLGDIRAIERGRIVQRLINKVIGRFVGKLWR